MNRPDSEVIGRIQNRLYEPFGDDGHHNCCDTRLDPKKPCNCPELDRQDEEDAEEERHERGR